jgi:general secretion pathway protein L
MATNEWLLLRLPAQGDALLTWAVADGSGRLASMPGRDAGDALHTMSTGRRIALLVPGGDVSLFQVPLPAANEARLLQLAPFALEDQLSQDVDSLHFAVGRRDAATGLVPVAVTERARMEQWMARAGELQLLPDAVFAESDLAPAVPNQVSMLVTEDALLLRNGDGRPLSMPANDPLLALEMLLGADADLAGVHLSVYAGPEEWPRHAAPIEALRERVASYKVQLSSGGLLALFALGLAQAAPVNLLQGTFRRSEAGRTQWLRWRSVAAAALVLVVLHFAGSWWQLRQVRAASAEMDASIASVFSAILPGQAPGSEPRRVLEQRFAALADTPGRQGELLPLLAAVAAAHDNVPTAQLESVGFRAGSLQLRVNAPTAAALEQFSQALRAGGYSADVISGQPQGERYAGQIALTIGGGA